MRISKFMVTMLIEEKNKLWINTVKLKAYFIIKQHKNQVFDCRLLPLYLSSTKVANGPVTKKLVVSTS